MFFGEMAASRLPVLLSFCFCFRYVFFVSFKVSKTNVLAVELYKEEVMGADGMG